MYMLLKILPLFDYRHKCVMCKPSFYSHCDCNLVTKEIIKPFAIVFFTPVNLLSIYASVLITIFQVYFGSLTVPSGLLENSLSAVG